MKNLIMALSKIFMIDMQARIYCNTHLTKKEKDILYTDCILDDIQYDNIINN